MPKIRENVRMVKREEVVATVKSADEKELMKGGEVEETSEAAYGWVLVGVLLIVAVALAVWPPF